MRLMKAKWKQSKNLIKKTTRFCTNIFLWVPWHITDCDSIVVEFKHENKNDDFNADDIVSDHC
jgi:hypothetical protein